MSFSPFGLSVPSDCEDIFYLYQVSVAPDSVIPSIPTEVAIGIDSVNHQVRWANYHGTTNGYRNAYDYRILKL